MRNVSKKKVLYISIIVSFFLLLLHPNRNAPRNYKYIGKDTVELSLYEETAANFTSGALVECDYRNVLEDESTLSPSLVDGDLVEGHRIREGGEYAPFECKPKFSIALIVAYRDRAEELRGFLVYMHTFLRHQLIHYRIFVVEQVDTRPFNRAKLLNIGALSAIKAGYPCLILHNVDLLPLKPANIYACTNNPRHMSCSINKYRFVLPYLNQFGGAVAIISRQYKTIDGMSNEYYGWDGEDNDLYNRLVNHNLKLCRFDPEVSQYHLMMDGSPKKCETKRKPALSDSLSSDGLSSLKYTEVATVLHPLFTHIMVDL